MQKSYTITTLDEYQQIIADISILIAGESVAVLALRGDLGAGKTTFIQEFAKSLGVTEVVVSPTFVIMKQYELSDHSFSWLVHIDLYRIESVHELAPLRLNELFDTPGTLVCIEWPERAPELFPPHTIWITINSTEDGNRQVEMQQSEEVGGLAD